MPTDPPVSTRLWLMAHAPAPDKGWIEEQERIHLQAEDTADQGHRDAKDEAVRRGNPRIRRRTIKAPPTAMDLDIRWRLAWADRALVLNGE